MKRYTKALIKQRIAGVFLILCAVCFIIAVSNGPTIADRESSAAVVFGVFGVYLLFTKKLIIV